MEKKNIIEDYFSGLEERADCRVIDEIAGSSYCLRSGNQKSEIRRFSLDDNIDLALSKFRYKDSWKIDYIEGSDLLVIGYVLAGSKIINYKGKHRLERGQVFYLRADEDIVLELDKSDSIYYFLDLSRFSNLLDCRSSKTKCSKENCSSYVDNICKRGELIIEDAPYANKTYREDIKSIKNIKIYNFLDYSRLKGQLFEYLNYFLRLRLAGRKGINKKRYGICQVVKAKKIIEARPEEDISVSELAEIMDISCYRLQNAFKRVEGTTVYNYMVREKMEHGKKLLEGSDLAIIDIAFKLGYENPSKFSSAFKRITGQTPSEYRKSEKD